MSNHPNQVLGSIVVSILACHARDRGSIPRRGENFFYPPYPFLVAISSSKLHTSFICRDSIVVSTLRCGRNNPGSNPGHGTFFLGNRGSLSKWQELCCICSFLFFKPKDWARPGFEPGTSRTLSENHTPRPTSQIYSRMYFFCYLK